MKSKLSTIIDEYQASGDPSIIEKLEAEIRLYSKEDRELYIVTKEETGTMSTIEYDNQLFVPVFTDEEYIKGIEGKVITCSINKIIKLLTANLNIHGVVFNPYTQDQYVDTITFIGANLGHLKKFEPVSKEWGEGIPDYKDSDILSKEEVLFLAFTVFNQLCSQNDMKLWFCTNEPDVCPNAIIEKQDKYAFIHIDVGSSINMPKLTDDKKKAILERATQFGYGSLYTSIGIYSNDQARADKGLLLRGDDFGAKFDGLTPIEE